LTDELILVFDAGTQSVRCGLFDIAGQVLDFIKLPITPYFSNAPGFAEQHPEYFWHKFCEASQQLLGRNRELAHRIKAVTVTTQRGVYINLDRNGKPLRPAISWLDERKADATHWAPLYLEAGMKLFGLYSDLDKFQRQCYSNWIRQHQPEIWERTYKYLLLSGYFHFQLTGNFVESQGSNFGYLPVDRKNFRWAAKNDLIQQIFPVEAEKLTDVVPQGASLGRVTQQASLDSGIPQGTPVIAASCDKSCEVLGSGTLTSDIGYLSFGTCATVNAVTDHFVELLPFLAPYPAAVPGHYVTEIPITRGFWMVSWFKQEFGLREWQVAQEKGISAEALFDELIREIPAGADGLMLQPYWSPNRVYSGDEGRGAVIGFSDKHTRAHLYRAILEGLIYALKDGAQLTTKKLGHPFRKLRVSGGGAQSQIAIQITADVFDLPVECPSVSETSALGAAMIAAVGQGYYPDYASAVAAMTSVRQVVQPIPHHRDLYQQLYNRVYRKMYAQLKPLYKELADINGKSPMT
jgi:sugar (pentulose or hexulose) kinase